LHWQVRRQAVVVMLPNFFLMPGGVFWFCLFLIPLLWFRIVQAPSTLEAALAEWTKADGFPG